MEHRRWWAIACLAWLCAAEPALAGMRNPVAGVGDLEFYADMSVFPLPVGARADLAVAVHHPQLSFEPGRDGRPTALIEVRVKLARQGFVAADTAQIFALQADSGPDATNPDRYQIVEMSLPVHSGRWAATIEVIDLQHREEGILSGASRGKGTAVLTVPAWAGEPPGVEPPADPPAAGPRLSDPEFRLASGRGELLPHPSRVYGLAQDTLRVYLEADGIARDASVAIELEIHDPVSGTRGADSIALQPQEAVGGKAAALYTLPMDSFLGGSYILRCTPSWDETAVSEAEFSVSWRMETVATGGRDMQLEAELLFSSKDAATFKQASPAARLRTLQERWDALDPTPGTAENEVYDEFLARVAYARRYFGEQLTPGQLTPRGRTYIRFGPPSEVSLEVIPYNEDELEDAIAGVHETLQTERPGAQFKQAVPETPAGIRAQRDRQIGAARANQEGAAFELWRYQLAGKPLIPVQAVMSDNVHLRFLFVDRLGTGEYRLEFTNLSEAR